MGKHALIRKRWWPRLAAGALAILASVGMVATALPAQADSSGVDVSSNNGNLNYGAIAASGQRFVIVKVNEGTYRWSGQAAAVAASRAAGMAVGYYGFISCSDGATQADIFNGHLADYRVGDPLILDYEGGCATVARANAWMQRMRQVRPNANLMIYMSSSVANGPINFSGVRGYGARLWVANYGADNGVNHGWPYTPAWTTAIHQYSSRGYVAGYRLDVNIARSDAWAGSALPTGSTTTTGAAITVSSPSETYNGYPTRTIQTLLTKRGYTCTVDGIYGQQTTAQVRAFQASRHLAVDGSVGPVTYAWLQRVYLDGSIGPISIRRAQAIAGTPIDGSITGGRNAYASAVTSGTRTGYSSLVAVLQRRMGGLVVDGRLGPRTVAKLQWWLTQHGYGHLAVDGYLGSATAKAWQKSLETGFLF